MVPFIFTVAYGIPLPLSSVIFPDIFRLFAALLFSDCLNRKLEGNGAFSFLFRLVAAMPPWAFALLVLLKNKNNIVDLQKKLAEAERKARLKDLTKTSYSSEEVSEIQRSLLDLMQEITGEKHFIGKEKDIFAGEPFNQTMHRNLDLLTRINYLTTAEESFLFRIQAYLEFKSNVIVCREDKFKKKRKNVVEDDYELPKAATVSDIAEMIGKSREKTSLIMNSLKKKEILLNPEGAGQVSENGRSVSPRTWIVNPYIMICAPRKNEVKLDKLTMRLFQHSLKNLKDQNGKKVNLPVRFF